MSMHSYALKDHNYIISLSFAEQRKEFPIDLKEELRNAEHCNLEILSGEPYSGYLVKATSHEVKCIEKILKGKIEVDIDQGLKPL